VASSGNLQNNMNTEARILTLAAKKAGKEATNKELAELNKLLRENPEIRASLKNILGNWDSVKFDHKLSEKEINDNISLVLSRVHKQIGVSETAPNPPQVNA
jgi:hypothetical protein